MSRSGTLYVFMHGLTVVSEETGDVEAVLPRVPGHVYKAGNWLLEMEVEPKTVLVLGGVKPGNQSFSTTSVTIRLTGCQLTPRGRAATLWLPKPKAILELLRAVAAPQPGYVARRKDNGFQFPSLATAHVLVYDYDDENEVFLEGHYWEPTSTGGAISLHIISTSPEAEGTEHQIRTEDAMTRLIQGYPGLEFPAQSPAPPDWRWYSTSSANLGELGRLTPNQGDKYIVDQRQLAFAQAELEPFGARTARLNRLGRMKQQGRPIQGLWHEPDPLGENPSNCLLVSVKR